jgi:hypothetical protein
VDHQSHLEIEINCLRERTTDILCVLYIQGGESEERLRSAAESKEPWQQCCPDADTLRRETHLVATRLKLPRPRSAETPPPQ